MKCKKAQEYMSRAVDGELGAVARARLERHVAGCPACQATRAAWQQAGDFLRTESVAVPSAEVMWADVQRAIRLAQPEPEPAFPAWRFKWAAALVGLALLGLGIWGILSPVSRSPVAAAKSPVEPVVEWAEAALPGASTMVYEDAESDTVVIWLIAENADEAAKGT